LPSGEGEPTYPPDTPDAPAYGIGERCKTGGTALVLQKCNTIWEG